MKDKVVNLLINIKKKENIEKFIFHPTLSYTPKLRGGKMRENTIENKLVKEVKSHGGLCLKFTSPSFNGVPDRLVLIPCGHIAFVEVKATGKTLRALQERRKRQLEKLGFKVYCLNDENNVEEIINEIQSI